MRTFISADKFFLKSMVKGPGYLEIVDKKFGEYTSELPEEEVTLIDYSGKWIAPGLVD
nr:N-acetylglucosamine-6-phosphate deacetylase [Enterococcus sp.]